MLRQAHDALGRDDGRAHAGARAPALCRWPAALPDRSQSRAEPTNRPTLPSQPSSLDVGAPWHFSRSLGGGRSPALLQSISAACALNERFDLCVAGNPAIRSTAIALVVTAFASPHFGSRSLIAAYQTFAMYAYP